MAVDDEASVRVEESAGKALIDSPLRVLIAIDLISAASSPVKPAAGNLELMGCATSAVAANAFGATAT